MDTHTLERSTSGRQKRRDIEEGNEIESDEIAQVSVTPPPNMITTQEVANTVRHPPIASEYDEKHQTSPLKEKMYDAAIQGNWPRAEKLLEEDPTLSAVKITERGDVALHVAVAMKHKEFVRRLVERMTPSVLTLQDGYGLTACCYAAISGEVKVAKVMLEKNPNLATARDKKGMTPLHKAVLCGNKKMASYLLSSTKVEDLSTVEWFGLLEDTISGKMYDVALEILEKDRSLATKTTPDGTALHLVAQQDISNVSNNGGAIFWKSFLGTNLNWWQTSGQMQGDLGLLAKKLWAEINKGLNKSTVLKIMKKPPILLYAAKVGNMELITMLTRAYPDLIWDADNEGHTMFHIAVIHRQENVFNLIEQTGGMKNIFMTKLAHRRNNILHLAAKLGPPDTRNIEPVSALQLQRELAWFKKVEAMVPPSYLNDENEEDDKQTPRKLFSKEHKDLLENSRKWMRNTANSCMLIATVMLSFVFAAAFSAPGGNDATGIPTLSRSNWFTCFVIFSAFALFSSTLCIIMFWSITSSGFEEDQFLEILPYQLRFGLTGLYGSLLGAISAFMSAYFLVFMEERGWIVKSVIVSIYVILVIAIYSRLSELWYNMIIPRSLSRMLSRHNLFSRYEATGKK